MCVRMAVKPESFVTKSQTFSEFCQSKFQQSLHCSTVGKSLHQMEACLYKDEQNNANKNDPMLTY